MDGGDRREFVRELAEDVNDFDFLFHLPHLANRGDGSFRVPLNPVVALNPLVFVQQNAEMDRIDGIDNIDGIANRDVIVNRDAVVNNAVDGVANRDGVAHRDDVDNNDGFDNIEGFDNIDGFDGIEGFDDIDDIINYIINENNIANDNENNNTASDNDNNNVVTDSNEDNIADDNDENYDDLDWLLYDDDDDEEENVEERRVKRMCVRKNSPRSSSDSSSEYFYAVCVSDLNAAREYCRTPVTGHIGSRLKDGSSQTDSQLHQQEPDAPLPGPSTKRTRKRTRKRAWKRRRRRYKVEDDEQSKTSVGINTGKDLRDVRCQTDFSVHPQEADECLSGPPRGRAWRMESVDEEEEVDSNEYCGAVSGSHVNPRHQATDDTGPRQEVDNSLAEPSRKRSWRTARLEEEDVEQKSNKRFCTRAKSPDWRREYSDDSSENGRQENEQSDSGVHQQETDESSSGPSSKSSRLDEEEDVDETSDSSDCSMEYSDAASGFSVNTGHQDKSQSNQRETDDSSSGRSRKSSRLDEEDDVEQRSRSLDSNMECSDGASGSNVNAEHQDHGQGDSPVHQQVADGALSGPSRQGSRLDEGEDAEQRSISPDCSMEYSDAGSATYVNTELRNTDVRGHRQDMHDCLSGPAGKTSSRLDLGLEARLDADRDVEQRSSDSSSRSHRSDDMAEDETDNDQRQEKKDN